MDWIPTIESVKRPIHHIALQGVITTVHNNSGLIKRCNKCRSIIHDSCPNNCNNDWGWDLRISCRVYEGSGSMVNEDGADQGHCFQGLAEKPQRLILLSNQPVTKSNQFQTSVCTIQLPDTIDIIEAVSEYVSSYRKSDKLIVTDGRNLAFLPTNEEHQFTEHKTVAC